jgi:polyphenol oxidase
MSIDAVTSPLLGGVRHGFLGRQGGVSQGMVAGLNVGLGSADDPAAVAENRRRARDAVAPGAALVTVFQVHGIEVATPESAWPDDARPHADALVTDRPGLALGILTADCAPVLFADREAGVIGAAHAGWKGAIGGVTDATVEAMEKLGARRDRIAAVVGPCITQPSYEVDRGFRDRFVAMDSANDRFFAAGRPDRFQFDLPGYVVARLEAAGLAQVASVGLDTLELSDRFYSFRRATLAGEPDYGRQISLIALG